MRPRFPLGLLALVACHSVAAQVQFTYPPAFVLETAADFGNNPVMVEGEYKDIQWENVDNPNNLRISVTVWQLNGTQFFGSGEYVIQNAPSDTLSWGWVVNTQKNLTLSPMFYMNLFLESETTSLCNSHYFNITKAATTSSSPSSSSTSTQTSSSSTSTSGTSSATSTSSGATNLPATTSSPPVVSSSGGLSTGGKVGIAVGVVGALLVGVLVGWLILGRMKKNMQQQQQQQTPVPAYSAANNPPGGYYEPPKVEVAQPNYSHEVQAEPIRYELPPETR